MADKKINKCQYWNLYEPPQCEYWDNDANTCTYSDEGDKPSNFPLCNLIGTAISCSKYKSEGTNSYEPRCILPDPRRHVCNRETGFNWVVSSGTASSGIEGLDYSPINGYNEGNCDGSGTDTTCSGYSPYHLGFGELKPSASEKYDTFEEGRFSTAEEFGYRLPLDFTVYNIRARLSKCFWWKGESGNFTLNNEGKIELSSSWLCSCPYDTSMFSEFNLENGPPCNGCKWNECPYYTGICWEYCISYLLETGDPVLAEQIHELRYYHREHNWIQDDIEFFFLDDGTIYAWEGSRTTDGEDDGEVGANGTLEGDLAVVYSSNGFISEYEIPAIKTNMDSSNDFDYFDVERENIVLTKGTEVTDEDGKGTEDYPTLIRRIQQLPLSPIIKNRFNKSTYGDNLFETPFLNKKESVMIYGKVFYVSDTLAINTSAKEINSIFPNELDYCDNIYEVERFLSEENFKIFNEDLEYAITIVSKMYGQKVGYNEFPNTDNTFMMEVPVLDNDETTDGTNKNTVFVFQKVNGIYTFDKISFNTVTINGCLFQTDFSVIGDGKAIRRNGGIPDYERGFQAGSNENGSMSFYFSPFISSGVVSDPLFIYNDAYVYNAPGSDYPIKDAAHKLYKITIAKYILEAGSYTSAGGKDIKKEYYVIGPNGLILIYIRNDDNSINNVFGEWEVESIILNQTRDDKTTTCELEILIHGFSGTILPNQLLVRPKNIEDYKAVCKGDPIILENITYYQKRSFGQSPDTGPGNSEMVNRLDNGESDYRCWASDIEFSGTPSRFQFTNDFEFNMTLGVVIADSSGRAITQSRTKPLGMVKQVTCPEVEIQYTWTSKYKKYNLKPGCYPCCGPWYEEPATVNVLSGGPQSPFWQRTMTADCGDHYYCAQCVTGPLLWPFNTCQASASYNRVTGLTNWEAGTMGVFAMKSGGGEESYIHGQHDMRMLTSQKMTGDVIIGCPFKVCSCDWILTNSYKNSTSWFSGWAKIRSGVSTDQIGMWEAYGSPVTVIFGNDLRPVLRSYLTMDQIWFNRLTIDPSTGLLSLMETKEMLMPAFAVFSIADITLSEDEMWEYFASEGAPSFVQDMVQPNVVNPLGWYLATNIDGISINEQIDIENRFKFEEIIISEQAYNLAYPSNVGMYLHSTGNAIINNCYQFKKHPTKDGYIQWAWQEIWKKLERNYNVDLDDDFIKKIKENGFVGTIKGNFIESSGVLGFFPVGIDYPPYLYSWKNEEFRLTIDEGDISENLDTENATIFFEAPEKDEYTGEYRKFPAFRLNDGPKRGITWAGGWLDEDEDEVASLDADLMEEYYIEFYQICTGGVAETEKNESGNPNVEFERHYWTEEVSLFNTGYDNTCGGDEEELKKVAEEDGRVVEQLTKYGDLDYIYFQRGLYVDLNPGMMGRMPLKVKTLNNYEISGDAVVENEFVCGLNFSASMELSFDNKKCTVGRLEFTYKFGSELISMGGDAEDSVYKFYHKPKLGIYAPENVLGSSISGGGVIGQHLYSASSMELYNGAKSDSPEIRTEYMEWDNAWRYIINGKESIVITLQLTPTEAQIYESEIEGDIVGRYESSMNSVYITNILPYEEILTDAKENLQVWERKYYVSYGGDDVYPTQGKENDDQVLKALPYDWSTIWQIDDYDGVMGTTEGTNSEMSFMNKLRGRHVFDIHEDEEELGDDVAYCENFQKKLYDKPASKSVDDTIMNGIIQPGLQEILTKKGISFGGPSNLNLHNSLVSKLSEINQFPNFSGEGYRYEPVPPSMLMSCPCNDDKKGYQIIYTCQDDEGGGGITSYATTPTILYTYYHKMKDHMLRRQMNIDLEAWASRRYARDTGNRIYSEDDKSVSALYFPVLEERRRFKGGRGEGVGGLNTLFMDQHNMWSDKLQLIWATALTGGAW